MTSNVLSFTKSQGLGNDFVLLDGRIHKLPEPLFGPSAIKALCDRHRGIGADGVIFLLPSRSALAYMRIFNADGKEAEACGNGWRCAVKYLWEHPISSHPIASPSAEDELNPKILIETQTGILPCALGLTKRDRRVSWIEIAMGTPSFERKDIPMLGPPQEKVDRHLLSARGQTFSIHPVSLGNPHGVIFLEDLNQSCAYWAKTYGPLIEQDPVFPSRANIGFARKLGPQNLELAVWERGCGLTQACGTGACAAVIVACKQGMFAQGERVTVHLPGGELEVQVLADFQNVLLRGPAREIFHGTMDPQLLG